MRLDFYDLFENWEIAIAKKLVTNHIQNWKCLRLVDYEDIMWECLSHWHMVKGTYSGEKNASRQTYMGRILRNKLQDIIRRQNTDKRKIWHQTVPLEEEIEDDENSPTLLSQLDAELAKETYRDSCTSLDLHIGFEVAKRDLNSKQQHICDLLQNDHSISHISKILATPRSTIYDEIERIRKIFESAGLGDYLK